jgi:mRNA-degrading endonuclease RelE of RelBE toxin-antitoxin system
MKSLTAGRFWKLYRQLPKRLQQQIRKTYELFLANPAHPSLHFHRLESEPELWSVRVDRDYRVVGLLQNDTISWFWVGSHAEFDRTFGP